MLTRGTTTVSCLQNLRTPSAPPNRAPMPEVFQPPIGAVVHIRFEITSLTLTAPQSNCRATAFARSTSLENTEALSPYGLSLASRTASSTELTFMIGRVGPKVSSVMHDIE